MYSRYLSALFIAAAIANCGVFRVCADPNNLPFSNAQRQGFDNKIAELLASAMNATLEYTWWPERKSVVKHTLDERRCDALLGVPATLDHADTTRPYYRSTYVFVSRREREPQVESLADPKLAELKIGRADYGR